MENKNFSFYTNISVQTLFDTLQTNEQGLSEEEAAKRLVLYGPNEIKEVDLTWFDILKNQILSPFMCIFFVIGLSYFFTSQIAEGIIVFAIIVVNVGTGFYQEYRSNASMQLLKKCLMSHVTVKRNGQEMNISINQLVPGDVILLYAGDIIPADCRFFSCQNLNVDESSLTGESVAVPKINDALPQVVTEMYKAENIGFTGTIITEGKGEAVVISTGSNTALGKIASLTNKVAPQSSLEEGSTKIMRVVLYLIFFSLVLTTLVHIIVNKGHIKILDLLLFCAALAITAIPEGLPMVITFCLSQGAAALKKNNVIVKKLSVIGNLGSVEVFCTDKTGTLTENSLSVASIYGENSDLILIYAILSSPPVTASKENNSKGFDLALNKIKTVEHAEKLEKYTIIKEVPFTPQKRFCMSLVKNNNEYTLITKGSPEIIIKKCNFLSNEQQEEIDKWIETEELRGNRILAIATKEITQVNEEDYNCEVDDDNYQTIGLIAFHDPLKETALSTVKKAESLGVQIKILSGDSKHVCYTIAQQLGLEKTLDNVVLGIDFENSTPEQKEFLAHNRSVFARVSPEQKYEIITHLQKKYSVGYMGDGINDAPALKIAHVGCAVNDAAPVAREAAEIILLRKSLRSIILGIEEGRRTILNTIKYTKMTNAPSFGHFYALSFASLLVPHAPMLPMQLLFLNLLTDLPMIAISTDGVNAEELKKPQRYDVKDITFVILIFGFIISCFDLAIFVTFKSHFPATLQTSWFITSTLTEIIFIFLLRTKLFFLKAHRPSILLIVLSLFVGLTAIILPYTHIGQSIFLFTPPKAEHIPWLAAVVILNLCVAELVKSIYYSYKKR